MLYQEVNGVNAHVLSAEMDIDMAGNEVRDVDKVQRLLKEMVVIEPLAVHEAGSILSAGFNYLQTCF